MGILLACTIVVTLEVVVLILVEFPVPFPMFLEVTTPRPEFDLIRCGAGDWSNLGAGVVHSGRHDDVVTW